MEKPYIDIISPEDEKNQSKVLQRAYRRIGGSRGNIALVHQSQSLNPKAMMAHLDFYMALMYADSPLSRIQRELIGTIVSYANSCEYCITHHYEALISHWQDAPSPKELAVGKALDTKDQLLVNYSIQLTQEPGSDFDAITSELKDTGFTDREILDMILIIGYFNFVNRLVIGTGIPLENESERDYKY